MRVEGSGFRDEDAGFRVEGLQRAGGLRRDAPCPRGFPRAIRATAPRRASPLASVLLHRIAPHPIHPGALSRGVSRGGGVLFAVAVCVRSAEEVDCRVLRGLLRGPSGRFRAQGAGCRVQGAGRRVQGAGCRVQGSGCRVRLEGQRSNARLSPLVVHGVASPKVGV